MAITKEELRDFGRFADEKVEHGEAASIVELAGQWEAQRGERSKPVADDSCVDLDIDATSIIALRAAFPDKLDDRKLQQALARRDGITTAELLAKATAAGEKASRK